MRFTKIFQTAVLAMTVALVSSGAFCQEQTTEQAEQSRSISGLISAVDAQGSKIVVETPESEQVDLFLNENTLIESNQGTLSIADLKENSSVEVEIDQTSTASYIFVKE